MYLYIIIILEDHGFNMHCLCLIFPCDMQYYQEIVIQHEDRYLIEYRIIVFAKALRVEKCCL